MSLLKTSRNQSGQKKLYEFTNGVEVDARLATQEIRVQKAWAEILHAGEYLSADELKRALAAFSAAEDLVKSGDFPWRIEDEDVHMNLERFLTEREGALGKKIHLGRSRNDLIATTLRLFVSDSLGEIATAVQIFLQALCQQAEKNIDVIVPGMTHVQHGQPIRLAQFFLAHAHALTRDLARLQQSRKACLEVLPLGSGALAGTTLNISLANLAQKLGFASAPQNSYDSISDRDFLIEALQSYALCALHLSRFSEDCIYYSSTALGLFKLSPQWSTGSSLMPNKRNPDVPELTRAKSARIMTAPMEALTLMKALPLSYNSDLHELKSTFMRAHDELEICLSVLPPFTAELGISNKRAASLCEQGHILATDIAEDLVAQGMPFREAYKEVAAQVEEAEKLQVQSGHKKLNYQDSVERRKISGGTARAQILLQIEQIKNTF